jgi:hypothetical protein
MQRGRRKHLVEQFQRNIVKQASSSHAYQTKGRFDSTERIMRTAVINLVRDNRKKVGLCAKTKQVYS